MDYIAIQSLGRDTALGVRGAAGTRVGELGARLGAQGGGWARRARARRASRQARGAKARKASGSWVQAQAGSSGAQGARGRAR